jgi:rare lipoprotein A
MALMSRKGREGARAPRHTNIDLRPDTAFFRTRARVLALAATVAVAALGGCASTQGSVSGASARAPMFPESKWGVSASRRVAAPGARIPKGGGVYKVGAPYQVGGRWYNPREQPDYDRIGVASWYGSDFHGRKTANGEIFDMHALTAAHPTLPMPSYAYVTNLANNRTILVRINDRGPYVGERMIDLSKASARELGLLSGGTGRVRVRYAGPAPLDGDDTRERQFLASRQWKGGTDIAARERAESAREWAAYRSGTPARPHPRSVPPRPRSYADAGPRAAGLWSPDQYRAALVAR